MTVPEYPVLQYRWKIRQDGGRFVLVYYGLRNPPDHTRHLLDIDSGIAPAVAALDGQRGLGDLPQTLREHPDFLQLVEEGILVDVSKRRQPVEWNNRQQCVRCVNDNLLLPGLEFDSNGVCAFCQCYEQARKAGISAGPANFVTEAELLEESARNNRSRFDVMVLCTGGKDSTYLLWLLAKKLKLRVLAASWNMPYTHETSRQNLRRAVEGLPNVELVERTLPRDLVRQAMRGQFASVGVPCLCPTVAHVLFFSLAVEERIPFIMQGVEEVQLAVASYVMNELKFPNRGVSVPVRSQRDMTLDFFSMVANPPKPPSPYAMNSEYLLYQRSVRNHLSPLYRQLDQTLDALRGDPSLHVPELRRLKTNEAYGTWQDVGALIKREMAWEEPPGHKGMLHTSCTIESVKDHCQFMRFLNMRTPFFPQSVIEVSAGVFFGLISREQGLAELEHLGYHGEPAVLPSLLGDLGIAPGEVPGEMRFSLCRGCTPKEV